MRMHILAVMAFSVSGLAHAASIDEVKTGGQAVRSIETIKCEKCAQAAVKKVVPKVELAPGTQKIEVRTVDGVKKIYRTEAWLGGSPVVFVSKVPETAADAQVATQKTEELPADTAAVRTEDVPVEQPATISADMIDESAKTSAVTADMGASVKIEPKKAVFDAGKLELRVD